LSRLSGRFSAACNLKRSKLKKLSLVLFQAFAALPLRPACFTVAWVAAFVIGATILSPINLFCGVCCPCCQEHCSNQANVNAHFSSSLRVFARRILCWQDGAISRTVAVT